MLTVTMRMMRNNVRMLIPAGIAILIGTMFIASTLLFGNTLDYSLRRQVSAGYGGANYAVMATDDGESVYGMTVGDLELEGIRALDGVRGVRPDITVGVEFTHGDSRTSGIAIADATPSSLMPIELSVGDWPQTDGEIVVPRAVADRLDVGVGDSIVVSYQGGGDGIDMTVSGLSLDPGGAYSYYGGAAAVDENTLARLSGAGDGGFSALACRSMYLDIEAPDGSDDARVLAAVDELLPEHFRVMSRSESEQKALEMLGGGQVDATTQFMLVFGVLALFVAALVIANTFQVLVAQRRRTLALLRVIGARKGQLYRSVVMEALLLGLFSSLVAVGLSIGLMQVLDASGLEFSGIRFVTVVTPDVLLIPVGFGVAVTVAASLGSARTATSVTPLAALQPLEISDSKRSGLPRMILSLLMIVMGAGATVFSVVDTWRGAHGDSAVSVDRFTVVLLTAMGGVLVFFLGVLLCANRWVPWLLSGIGVLVSRIGPASTIAVANIRRNPRRVAATSTALLVGVALVATLGTGAATARRSLADELDANYSVDIQISGDGIDRTVLDEVRDVDGIGKAELIPSYTAFWHNGDSADGGRGDQEIRVYSLDSTVGHAVMNGDAADGLSDGVMLVSDALAGNGDGYAVRDGAVMDLGFDVTYDDGGKAVGGRTVELTAKAAAFQGMNVPYRVYGLVETSTLEAVGIEPDGYEVWARTDGTLTPADVIDGVQTALESHPGVTVGGSIAERVTWDGMVNMLLLVLVALLAVAVVIALIGVANTLSLSVIERTRESATLRAIGMTRRQLRCSLAMEALLISLASGVVGIVLGALFGWIGSYIVFSGSFGSVSFSVDWGMSAAILGVATVAALLASVAPARRAVRTPPVAALAER